jgi:dUTP diphosphatase
MLSGEELRRTGLVSLDAATLEAHVQPNGIDLSVDALWRFAEAGVLGRVERSLPPHEDVAFDADDWAELTTGTYGFRYAEWVALPTDCGALCFPRSSLLRMGVHVPTAVWDAGYEGRGEGLLVVSNSAGVKLQRGARIAQLVVFRLSEPAAQAYTGQYQHEGR